MTITAPDVLVGPDSSSEEQALALCRPSNDVTATLRGLTMHHHDPPYILFEFNPWNRSVRAESETPHAWADGGWSGHEWADMVTVPINVLVKTTDGTVGTPAWLALQQPLAAAFAPSHVDIPLTFTAGADEYVIYGRPRLVEPLAETAFRGWALCRAAFRALDPTIYSGGAEHTVTLVLPLATGGLTVPFEVPFTIGATVVGGSVSISNAGTAPTGLTLRIDGPVVQPRVTLVSPGGTTRVLRYLDTIDTGDYLVIDTKARTAFLNGTVSRRNRMAGDWMLLEPGTSQISFDAGAYDGASTLTVTWRDAYIA